MSRDNPVTKHLPMEQSVKSVEALNRQDRESAGGARKGKRFLTADCTDDTDKGSRERSRNVVQFLVQKWCSFVKHRGSSATARGVRREKRLSRERSRELKSFKLTWPKRRRARSDAPYQSL